MAELALKGWPMPTPATMLSATIGADGEGADRDRQASPEQIRRFVDVRGHSSNRPARPVKRVNARIVFE